MSDRIVLAYSGGLDTSVCIGWLGEETGQRGRGRRRRRRPGRRGHGGHPAARPGLRRGRGRRRRRQGRVRRGLLPARAAGQRALHGPLPAGQRAVPAADRASTWPRRPSTHGATTVSHGCTGKGNDQVRFEVGIANLAPDLKVIAPVRDYAWTREKAIAYAEEKGLPIDQSKSSRRTRSTRTSGAGRSRPASWRTSGTRPIEDVYAYTADPADAAGRRTRC